MVVEKQQNKKFESIKVFEFFIIYNMYVLLYFEYLIFLNNG